MGVHLHDMTVLNAVISREFLWDGVLSEDTDPKDWRLPPFQVDFLRLYIKLVHRPSLVNVRFHSLVVEDHWFSQAENVSRNCPSGDGSYHCQRDRIFLFGGGGNSAHFLVHLWSAAPRLWPRWLFVTNVSPRIYLLAVSASASPSELRRWILG